MAQATVFVDDAIRGTLPPICVKDGTPTVDRLVVRTKVGTGYGGGIAWLLLLAGPLGWLGLLIFAMARGPADVLTVQLPFSASAHERFQSARRGCWVASIATMGLVAVALIGITHETFDGRALGVAAAVAAFAALVRWVVELQRLQQCSVGISLDASRRWVTISRVHPAFFDRVLQDQSYVQRV
jgi:hypothetical protein